MSNVAVVADEQPGSLSAIQDRVAANEIGKLWHVVQSRFGYAGKQDNTVVVQSDLDAAVKGLSLRIDNLKPAGPAAATVIGGGSSASAGSFSGDLLATNNAWLGTQNWTVPETFGVLPYQFNSLTAGVLAGFPGVQGAGYQATVDIRKTSSAKPFATLGGNAALFVQHRIDNTVAAANSTNAGLAVMVSTQQQSTAPINNVIGGFFSVYHNGSSVAAFGLQATIFHVGAVGPNSSFGVCADLWRQSTSGYTAAFHARVNSAGAGYFDNDYAFLASSGVGNNKKFKTGLSLGSAFTGQLTCDVGIDMGWCTITTAAIIIPGGTPIVLNVANSAALRYVPGSNWFQLEVNANPVMVLTNGGNMAVLGSMTINSGAVVGGGLQVAGRCTLQNAVDVGGVVSCANISLNAPASQPAAGALVGYWTINFGGVLRAIPLYN